MFSHQTHTQSVKPWEWRGCRTGEDVGHFYCSGRELAGGICDVPPQPRVTLHHVRLSGGMYVQPLSTLPYEVKPPIIRQTFAQP
ncbi:hypothetical protein PILCRDRAFT_498452 [Piloderma croceum F 1598]|uniref:Uncharacterized protein n=1 Tax=Piloderma croceum (strain F 1598) TaxID=765440 RepID=A0A0C3FAL4_PILCF|nr:hypothetical protein PILCRDRAFT_498452 [Piloderma croceum F 1598]